MKWFLALIASSVVLVASAIEPPKTAPSPATPPAKEQPAQPAPAPTAGDQPAGDASQPAADSSKPADAAAADDDEELPPLAPDAVQSGPPPARFNPTEKVRADFPVSFPIDI